MPDVFVVRNDVYLIFCLPFLSTISYRKRYLIAFRSESAQISFRKFVLSESAQISCDQKALCFAEQINYSHKFPKGKLRSDNVSKNFTSAIYALSDVAFVSLRLNLTHKFPKGKLRSDNA